MKQFLFLLYQKKSKFTCTQLYFQNMCKSGNGKKYCPCHRYMYVSMCMRNGGGEGGREGGGGGKGGRGRGEGREGEGGREGGGGGRGEGREPMHDSSTAGAQWSLFSNFMSL